MIEIQLHRTLEEAVPGENRLPEAVRRVLNFAGFTSGEISLALVSDEEIHEVNRRWLEHDYPTDVISFVLESEPPHLEGEIIISFDTARRDAARYGWLPDDELLLYAIHGALHLVGHDDLSPEPLLEMRKAERRHLAEWNLQPRYTDPESHAEAARTPLPPVIGGER